MATGLNNVCQDFIQTAVQVLGKRGKIIIYGQFRDLNNCMKFEHLSFLAVGHDMENSTTHFVMFPSFKYNGILLVLRT